MNELEVKLEKIVILGAGGKMGRGIALLLLRLVAERPSTVYLIDPSEEALADLRVYLTQQLEKTQAKDSSLPASYIEDCLDKVRFARSIEQAKGATLALEAATEEWDLKLRLLKELSAHADPDCDILTNTSSLPIGLLDEAAGLKGRLIGFHFYNPPPVQRLVEVIRSKHTRDDVHQRAVDLGLALNKILVPSNDVAGFIGNGHFMRDLLFACQLVEELKPDLGIAAAISWIDRITRDALIRPMGIFQLADYVGLDVCQKILHVMNTHIEGETLHSPFIDSCLAAGLRGGQEPDGSQRPGIFSYEKGRPRAIFQANGAYGEIPPLPHPIQPLKTWKTWKEMRAEADMSHALHAYFAQLWTQDDPSSELAKRYLCQSRKSAQTLLEHGVAKSADDVNKVLCYGFFHLYGPLSPCIPEGTLESPVQ